MKNQKKNNIIAKNNPIIKLEIYHENKIIFIERDKDWNINITSLAKSLGKNWQNWYKYHKKKVQCLEVQSGIKQIVRATPGRYNSTWITFELATQVLNAWSTSFAYQFSCLHKSDEVISLQKRIFKLDSFIKNQKKRKRRYLIGKGPCIYCYTTNGLRKIGFSSAIHQRTKNHETSVGKFVFDWIFFMEHAKKVEEAIYSRFLYPKERPVNNREHFRTSAEKLKEFVISYSRVMNYSYKEVADEELKFYADSV
jgi:hypothetical protein